MTTKCTREKGFTLLELVVTLGIFTILALTCSPYVTEFYDELNERSAEMQILHDMRYLQALTVEQGCRGILKIEANNKNYSFGCDYLPYSAAETPTFDTSLFSAELPNKFSMSTDAQVIFNSRGESITTHGDLDTRTIYLKLNNVTFNIGTLRPTGFFELQY